MAKSTGLSKILILVLVVALAILAYVNYTKRVQIAAEMQKLSVKVEQLQTGNQQENAVAAKQIVDKVRRFIAIPEGVEPTVAQIVDITSLRARNSFYNNAENGDYLIVTPTRAILWSSQKQMIIDVVPVQLQQPTTPTAAKASASVPAATSSSTAR